MLKKIRCNCCGHEWVPRTENPKECPACKSRRWEGGKNGKTKS